MTFKNIYICSAIILFFVLFVTVSLDTMGTKAELEVMVTELKKQLAETEEALKTAQAEKTHVVVNRDKKFEKFNGSQDFYDWADDIFAYVDARYKDKDGQKVCFIVDHLSGKAKQEVKFRLDTTTASSADLKEVLECAFGVHEDKSTLLQKFFNRNQQDESTDDYAFALMNLMMKLRRKDPKMFADADKFMKEKYADGVADLQLKLELKRLNEDRPALKFHELRERAKKWSETTRSVSSETTRKVEDENPIDMKKVMEQLQELKLQYQQHHEQPEDEVTTEAQRFYRNSQFSKPKYRPNQTATYTNDGQQRKWTSTTKKTPDAASDVDIICNYCRYPNHIARHCRKQFNDKMAQGAIKQETEVEAEESEEHLNEQHPG